MAPLAALTTAAAPELVDLALAEVEEPVPLDLPEAPAVPVPVPEAEVAVVLERNTVVELLALMVATVVWLFPRTIVIVLRPERPGGREAAAGWLVTTAG